MVNEDLVEVADSGELLSASQIIDRMWSNAVKNVTYKHVASGHNRAQTMEPKRLEQLVIEMARENTKNNAQKKKGVKRMGVSKLQKIPEKVTEESPITDENELQRAGYEQTVPIFMINE